MVEAGDAGRAVQRAACALLEAAEDLVPGGTVEAVVETPLAGAPLGHVSRIGRGGPVRVTLLERDELPAGARFALGAGHPHLADDGRDVAVPLLRDGGTHGVLVVRRDAPGAFGGAEVEALGALAGSHALAVENALLRQRLEHEAEHDLLTGLANRRGFTERLERALADRAETGWEVAVLVLGLDGFRDVNAALGHRSGDRLLAHVADAVLGTVPLGAQVARVAGDEFAVLLTGVLGAGRTEALAHRLQVGVAAPVTVDGVELQAAASVGVAVAHPDLDDARALLGAADVALARAKQAAGGVASRVAANPERRLSLVVADAGPRAVPAAHSSMATLADLRRALRGEPGAGEIVVHLQPQADAATGRIVGAEALARWQHPHRGLLLPLDFVPLADRHGLMLELTEVVLDRAVETAARCRDDGHPISVSVNLSARCLVDGWLTPTVTGTLERHRLPAHALTLEITEDSMICDPEHAVAVLDTLRATGVRLSVDDFGTGWSSLAYLRRLPVDEVKIDKSFVGGAEGTDLVIARSVVDLARNLGLETVAEGVEDDDTWERLAAVGCHAVQGWALARAMPADDLRRWLTAHVPDRTRGRRTRAGLPA